MLLDHDNLLSTFGKDSQSSNRKNNETKVQTKNNKHMKTMNYNEYEYRNKYQEILNQPRNKYQEILNQRKTLLQKKPLLMRDHIDNQIDKIKTHKISSKQGDELRSKQGYEIRSKKIRTQSDIDTLNSKIRKSISGIAETICKSKINSQHQQNNKHININKYVHNNHQLLNSKNAYANNNNRVSSLNNLTSKHIKTTNIQPVRIQSFKQLNNTQYNSSINKHHNKLKSSRYVSSKDKQNLGNFINNNNNYNHNNQNNDNKVYKKNEVNNNKKDMLRNSTKKKATFFQQSNSNKYNKLIIDQCPIKSSFSIDLNSQCRHNNHNDSVCSKHYDKKQQSNRVFNKRQQSSRIVHVEKGGYCSKFDSEMKQPYEQKINMKKQSQNHYRQQSYNHQRQQSLSKLNKFNHISVGNRKNEDTLKKQFKHQLMLVESNYIQPPRLQQNTKNKFTTRTTMSSCNVRQQQQHYQHHIYNNNHQQQKTQQYSQQQKYQDSNENSPNFNNIQVPKRLSIYDIKKNITLYEHNQQRHPLIKALMEQIELDYDLRHAKHMFSGIQQPFINSTNRNMTNRYSINMQSQSKWHLLNQQLINRGLEYSVDTIKKIFLPSQQQLDPFLSVTQPHDQLIHSLIYAYETAQIHWQQTIYKKWQHWDLRDIQLTIENIDRDRKGYITVQDIAAFISMQSSQQYKNRDLILIYKRLINNFTSNNNNNTYEDNNNRYEDNNNRYQDKNNRYQDKNNRYEDIRNSIQPVQTIEDKNRLKFRSLIDSLIKNF